MTFSKKNTNDLLADIGWDEGISIPIANSENKKLAEQVQADTQVVDELRLAVQSNDERVNSMYDHLRNVRQELSHTLGLIKAREKEVSTEQHMKKITERELGRLKDETAKLQRTFNELDERKNLYQNQIFKKTQKIDKLKADLNWDQQALDAWLKEAEHKDEDALVMQKYMKQDENSLKSLSLQIEHMTKKLQMKKKKLDQETIETQSIQVELDKTAEAFRIAHEERQDLISRWERTIDKMQKRDKEIEVLGAELSSIKGEVGKKEWLIKEKHEFMENLVEGNQEIESKISLLERNAAQQRLELATNVKQSDDFQSELEALRRTVDRTSIDLEATRSHIKQLKKEIAEKEEKLLHIQQLKEKCDKDLKDAINSKLSAEEQANEIESLLALEERKQGELESELTRLRDQQFKQSQSLQNQKQVEKTKEAEIQGTKAAIKNLDSQISKLDKESLKQQEIMYNQDFSIQQLERRLAKMSGEINNEEKLVLEKKIKTLTDQLEEKQESHRLLNQQLKRLQDDLRLVKREYEQSGNEKSLLVEKIEEMELHIENSERELKKLSRAKQERMVDDNLMKLEIKRLRELLSNKADNVLSLEKRQLQLETTMKERKQEISVHREMIEAQLKTINTERQKISLELHERMAKIDKLRKRYEILTVAMAGPDGESDQSQAYYVIKAAQEKEEMQRTGDELDFAIRKAEKEIRALENTVRLMNSRNETYKDNFQRLGQSGEEIEEKQRLDEQSRAINDKLKYKRKQVIEMEDDVRTLMNSFNDAEQEEYQYRKLLKEKEMMSSSLQEEIDEQKKKLERINYQNQKAAKDLRKKLKQEGVTIEEKDFEVRDVRELNKMTMRQIAETSMEFPELQDTVNAHFAQANIPIPSTAGLSSGSSSVASSRMQSRNTSRSSSLLSGQSSIEGFNAATLNTVNIGFETIGEERNRGSRKVLLHN